MESQRWARIEALFHDALERPEGERAAFVAHAAADDVDLRDEVLAMLAAHDSRSGMRIESTLLAPEAGAPAGADPREGTRVGAWRLGARLGGGGMGDVWLAARADGAYEKQAAVKLVRFGLRRDELRARFERERQVLARLVHPNIATLLDGGVTESGEPYLVMEYVEGTPITEWCDARGLDPRARLALFERVCEAVQFAHANLVVHRDLKPANILVTADGRPVLLDFGIAKLLDPLEQQSPATRADDRVLTPEYAAPEQLRGEPVTVATDVWGLGVLLYELLTGERPFRAEGASWTEIAKRVQEREATPPSERFRTLAGAADAEALARRHGGTPVLIARALRGDLDAIVAHALRKEPARRYATAAAFADDVRRHLAGLPVRARPDSAAYRLASFARRHRAGVAAGAVLALALLAFGIVSTWQAGRIARERDRARAEEARANRVLGVLVDLFAVSNPEVHPGGDTLRVADLLRLAEARIDSIDDQPLVQARLWETVASIHAQRSEYPEQKRALDRGLAAARAAKAPDVAIRLRHDRALLTMQLEGPQAGLPALRASVAEIEARYPGNDERVASALDDLASALTFGPESPKLHLRALAMRRALYPQGSAELAASLVDVADETSQAGHVEPALAMFDEALAMMQRFRPADHPDMLRVRLNRARCLSLAGRFAAADSEFRRVQAMQRKLMGPRTMTVAGATFAVGQNLLSMGALSAAADTLAAAHDILASIMGADHHATLGAERHLAYALLRAGRAAEGRRHLAHVLAADARNPGPPSQEALALQVRMAAFEAARTGRPDPAPLRAIVGKIRASRPGGSRLLVEGLLQQGAAALANPASATPGEAATCFAQAAAMADTFYAAGHPAPACARLGAWLARGAPLTPGARDTLDAALARCEPWGYAPPALIAIAHTRRDAAR